MTVINPGGSGGAVFTQGTAAAKPAATANALYFATDSLEWWVANAAGNAWQSIGSTSNNAFKVPLNGQFGNSGAGGNLQMQNGQLTLQNAFFDFQPSGLISLYVREGANCGQGVSTLVAGTVVVANTSVTATSRIFVTSQADGGTPGFLRVSARTAGTSFTVTSSNVADTSTFAWEIFQPGL